MGIGSIPTRRVLEAIYRFGSNWVMRDQVRHIAFLRFLYRLEASQCGAGIGPGCGARLHLRQLPALPRARVEPLSGLHARVTQN